MRRVRHPSRLLPSVSAAVTGACVVIEWTIRHGVG
jgi:hypothetical protein